MPGYARQFRKYKPNEVDDFGEEYDYCSIMHYADNVWSKVITCYINENCLNANFRIQIIQILKPWFPSFNHNAHWVNRMGSLKLMLEKSTKCTIVNTLVSADPMSYNH